MPEQLTKHPDVTLQVLRSGGAQCAAGQPQEILTACPAERFCKLPGGEICVYGLGEMARMTQITPAEWHGAIATVPRDGPASGASGGAASADGAALIGGGFVAGAAMVLAATGIWRRWRGNRR
jgi:hypothetical protein